MIIEDMPGSLGAEVFGVDILNATDVQITKIKQAIYNRKIVIVKEQDLSESEFCEFSSVFGTPVPYLQENYHHPDFPLIFVSSNVEDNGKKIGVPRTGGYWHSDTSFLSTPIPLTMLRPKIIPKSTSRTTKFIDLAKALNELPARLKIEIDGKNLVHSGRYKYKVRETDVNLDIGEILGLIDSVQPPVTHPAVIEHPITREKALYLSRGFVIGMEDDPSEEAGLVLNEIFDFVEQEEYITELQWAQGDVIIFDNRCLAHRAGRREQSANSSNVNELIEEDTMVYKIIVNDGHPLSL